MFVGGRATFMSNVREAENLIQGESVVLTLNEISTALAEFASEPMYEDVISAIGSHMIDRVLAIPSPRQPELRENWDSCDEKYDIAREIGLSIFRDETIMMSFMNFLIERGLAGQAEEGEYIVGEDGDILMDIIVAQLPESDDEDDIGLCLMFGAENMDAVALRVLEELLA